MFQVLIEMSVTLTFLYSSYTCVVSYQFPQPTWWSTYILHINPLWTALVLSVMEGSLESLIRHMLKLLSEGFMIHFGSLQHVNKGN